MSKKKAPRKKAYRPSQRIPKLDNPIAYALAIKSTEADIEKLQTDAGLQIIMGRNPSAVLKLFGGVIFLPVYALHNQPWLWDTPELNIIAATAKVIDELPHDHAWLERNRASIHSAYNAAQRLLPKCSRESLVDAYITLHYLPKPPAIAQL